MKGPIGHLKNHNFLITKNGFPTFFYITFVDYFKTSTTSVDAGILNYSWILEMV